ncbi:Protein CBG06121 [Caenorhabditis briggsae]|uniref:BOD1/SHG1 domain-containing protein n=3 Tax=Caenorhabditis TaxID=6237 RepID=A0AAE9ABI2_CAEBR|nr:Protein CBG06121 [Caenorhabditis briggsae]PIC34375.1 hypothetical protein B9Z55_014047 [Caenorhabditis nigoni]ULT95482.1 hypothetical protein L3Y34_004304 [Caenorhabditis briggsae]CAP26260.1 Protein CBG06121 [Caenorhabditis briggsae]
MSGSLVDERSIVAKVDMELKKGGTFDKLRKKATEHIKESELLQRIEKETLQKVDEIMESSSNISKEEIQRKLREYISSNHQMRNDINRQTRIELDKSWVQDTLKEEIEEKVTKQLEDMV